MSALTEAKDALRKQMRSTLAALDEGVIQSMSMHIVAHILDRRDWLLPGSHVALFGGIRGEPNLVPLIPWLVHHQIHPVLFGFANDELVPQIVTSLDQLTRGAFGVFAPRADCPVIEVSALNLIFTPALAFDRRGMRLGRGRGYFDRLFARSAQGTQRVGVCFECQLVADVPAEPHDAAVNAVLTERGIIISQVTNA